MKVNEEKIAQIMIVRFETSTSPNWYEIKKYIREFFKTLTYKSHIYIFIVF